MPLSRGRLMLLRTVTEEVWRNAVVAWAKARGWRVYFTWSSKHSPAGYPDLTMVRPPRLIFIELKAEDGTLSRDQEKWIGDLQQCTSIEVYIWRPHDEERVQEVLT